MSANNLNERTNYQIINLKKVTTTYGDSYIMTDTELNEYWSNKKINEFIKKNKIPMNNDDKVLFKIKTGEYKVFPTEDGRVIKFLNLICMKK